MTVQWGNSDKVATRSRVCFVIAAVSCYIDEAVFQQPAPSFHHCPVITGPLLESPAGQTTLLASHPPTLNSEVCQVNKLLRGKQLAGPPQQLVGG